eukprot:scaffold788_cov56-Attheya_sp.AAC.12
MLHLHVQTLDELQSRNVGNRAECQRLGRILRVAGARGGRGALHGGSTCGRQVPPQGIDNGVHVRVVSTEQETEGDIAHLLLRVLGRPDESEYLGMAKVHLVAQHVDVHQLPHVLFARVGRERRIAPIRVVIVSRRKLFANVGQLLVHPRLLLRLAL